MKRETMISFLEEKEKVEALDKLAYAIGTDRSSMLRIILRDRLNGEADSALARYKENR